MQNENPIPGVSGESPHGVESPLLATALGALGVVFGDIGTSPLYAVNACFGSKVGIMPTQLNVFGILSCIFWSLTFVIGVKYALFIMRADDEGEGGVFALLGLLQRRGGRQRSRSVLIVFLAACGASLLYGDGVITPAMSVISAIEGLELVAPGLEQYVMLISIVILVGLFSVQRFGVGPVGKVFGPLMIVWFLWIAGFGVRAIVLHPEIVGAVNPWAAVRFFAAQPFHAFLVLGGVVLCVTGGEALYADLGHFSRRSIRLAWYGLVWPALLLNYFGQGAHLLHDAGAVKHPFFAIVPDTFLIPSIVIATIAAVIASQAIITGAFSLTRQGMRLGLLPRFVVKHLSQEIEGRVYLPKVNFLMACLTLLVVIVFRSSSAMAGAYGIAVTAVMGSTTVLFGAVLRYVWKWSWWRVLPLVTSFLAVDLAFFGANIFKIASGGWFPIAVAIVIASAMITWRTGRQYIDRKSRTKVLNMEEFSKRLHQENTPRTPGVGVFPTNDPEHVPAALVEMHRHLGVVPEIICVVSMSQSFAPRSHETEVTRVADGFWLVMGSYGYMQNPSVSRTLVLAHQGGLPVDIGGKGPTYFVNRERVQPSGHSRLLGWQKRLFMGLSRSAAPMTDFFDLPGERVMEIGVHVEV